MSVLPLSPVQFHGPHIAENCGIFGAWNIHQRFGQDCVAERESAIYIFLVYIFLMFI